jgi:hypothetical protein
MKTGPTQPHDFLLKETQKAIIFAEDPFLQENKVVITVHQLKKISFLALPFLLGKWDSTG